MVTVESLKESVCGGLGVSQRNRGGLEGKAEQGSGNEVGLQQEVGSCGVKGRDPAGDLSRAEGALLRLEWRTGEIVKVANWVPD